MGKAKEPIQMNLPFARPYAEIAINEAARGIKAIIKELIRFGMAEKEIGDIVDDVARGNPIVGEVIDLMDEKILARDD